MHRSYLVRHGAMGTVGRFAAVANLPPLPRGASVVIRGPRGTELGELLAPDDSAAPESWVLLRPAAPEDRNRASAAAAEREASLSTCLRFFDAGRWPFSVVDVEPLLDPRRAVLYYFGPHALDTTGLHPAALDLLGLDLFFEPVGPDLSWDAPTPAAEEEPSCSSCGRAGGGGGCGTSSSSCSSCALSSSRRRH
jgi:hypothetical protein